MKLNRIFGGILLVCATVLTQACLPTVPIAQAQRNTEEIFSLRNESGADIRACVYYYDKSFTAQERELADLRLEVMRLEDSIRTLGSAESEADKAKIHEMALELEQARGDYLNIYSRINSPDFDKEVYIRTADGTKIQIATARTLLNESIIRFVSEDKFTTPIADRKNIYMFGANLAIERDGNIYFYDMEPLYSNIVSSEKETYEFTPTFPAFFPFNYKFGYNRVNLRKDNVMSEEYRLSRLVVANFMDAYNFGISKRTMPRNATLTYQLVLLDDMKLYVRPIERSVKEYWGSRQDFIARFKDRQEEYRGFPVSPVKVVSAKELEELKMANSEDDFSWANNPPARRHRNETEKTFDDTMYKLCVDAVKNAVKKK